MVNYKCSICSKEFNHKGDYKRHMNRKNKCKEKSSLNIQNLNKKNIVPKKEQTFQNRNIERFICIYCNRSYSRRPNLNKHLKTCKSKKEDELKKTIKSYLQYASNNPQWELVKFC